VLQRLQDAITKLEQFRDRATGGEWSIEDRIESSAITTPVMEDGEVGWVADVAEFLGADDARLIVTLHTMLPPILDWMRDQLARIERDEFAVTDESRAIHYRHVLAVADAILGGVS
jgi:hypothetical protein